MEMKRYIQVFLFVVVVCFGFVLPKTTQAGYQYVSEFGSSGSGDGQFLGMLGIAISTSTGNIFVTDSYRVQVFNSSGTFLTKFGTGGSGNGQFNIVTGIALDSMGNIFVAEYNNNRVQKFNSSGVYQSKFGTSGTGNGQFNQPYGIAISTSTGNIYIVDKVNTRVQVFNSAGVYQSQFGSSGSGDGQFGGGFGNGPYGIALDSSDNVYVVDNGNSRVQKFNSSGVYQSKFGTSGTGNGQFNDPAGIAISTSTGDIFVNDSGGERVQVFNSAGVYQSQFGSEGSGDGQFEYNFGIALDSANNVYVTDHQNMVVQKFSYFVIVKPTITTSGSSSVGSTKATLNGIISNLGNESSTQHGFAYGTSTDLSIVIATTTLGTKSSTGSFTSAIIGLTEATTYYVRAYATNSEGTGYGSIESFTTAVPTAISSCAELQNMNNNLANDYFLASDIDCSDTVNWNSGEGFEPVGTSVAPFTGSLDGAGYTISNLIINRPADDYVGLIGYGDENTFHDLTITGSVTGLNFTGALVGAMEGGSILIDNVHIEANVVSAGENYIGGMIGYAETTNETLTITASSMSGDITVVSATGAESIGGFIGYTYTGNVSPTIENSHNSGNINVTAGTDVEYGVGGLVGYSDSVLDITDSYNSGNLNVVAGTYVDQGIGGLLGLSYSGGNISGSYNIGDINVTAGTYIDYGVGGLFGYSDDDTTITNSFSQGNININSGSTVSYVGGLLGIWDYSSLSISDTYSSTDITINASSTITGVGGFIGALQDTGAVISESFSSGLVSATSDTLDYANIGGFMGEYTDSTLSLIYYDKTNSNQNLCISSIDPDPVSCTAIESNSTYFLGNNTSEPMASWNFSTIWSTVSGKLPILTALASPYTTLTTSSASSVTKTGAVLNATISTLSGGSSATVRGFAWGTSSTYSATTTSSGSFSAGAFTTTLSDLTCNTTYHFRAYATNPSTTGFSSDATFTTEACATASSGGGGRGSGSRARVVPSPIATTTPTTIQIPKLLLNLKLGDSNPEVTTLQTILVSLGFLKVSPTGYFGILTETALKAYQVSKGLPPVGVVGPLTRDSLNSLTPTSLPVTTPTNPIPPATTTLSIYTRNLDIGSTGDDVRALQSFLTSKGYTVPSTGYFGPLTQSALAKFQKDNGISPAVGYFGPVTRGRVR